MSVSMEPYVGGRAHMKLMGDDVFIEISSVPETQPCLESEGCYIVEDQYGQFHLVEQDGDDFLVVNSDTLSDEGFDAWTAFVDARVDVKSPYV